jgi:predicted nucleotidyltransferase
MKPHVQKRNLDIYEESARNKVAEVLFKYPEKEFSLSDLAKEAGTAKANIGNILDEFSQTEVITIEKLSKIWRIRANQTSRDYIENKIVYNLHTINNSGLVEVLIEKFNNPKAIVLFGSFRKGEDISTSDIDIAIETDDVKEYEVKELDELSEFEKLFGKKIQLHVFTRKAVDINVFNNIANGIVLWGFLEVNK